jgi:HAE1 family hydrophobic/amphiphilic exporter-1
MIDFFINRPIFATVCSLLIILAGLVSIPTLPIAQFPNLAPPQVNVSSFYNGASAEVVEAAVTNPLEQQINGVEGMKYITSSSSSDGSSSINVVFDLNRNVDIAAVDVQNRVTNVTGRLPAEVNTTGIAITKSNNNFVFAAGFYAENQKYDSLFISNYLDVYVKDALKRIKGVGDVFIFGERRYSMRIWLDPVRMASRKLTASDVVDALREQNVQVAAGQLGQPPAPTGQSFQISVRAVGRLTDPREFSELILKNGADGSLVKLKDVGTVELGAEGYGSNLEFNGFEAVGIGITQLTNANALEVDRAALAELDRLSRNFPPGLQYRVAFDTTESVSESIRDVLITLTEAILLVILVIFVFLQDWRTTLIPAITIPVSLIGTFTFVKLLGFSVNTLTLFGITLATGLVVDDAIVVIENIERHISEGIHNAHRAASVAMKEVASAVIATSIVLVAVFVPVAFYPGTTGLLFKQFALTIAFSVSISAFNALTLTPALSAILLGRKHHVPAIFRWFNRAITAGTARYKDSLQGAVRYRLVVLVLFFVGIGLTWLVFQKVPRGFVPEEDQGWFMTIVQAPEGASLEYTTQICKQVQQVLTEDKDVQGVFSVAGFSFVGSAPNRGIVFASMNPYSQRKGKGHTVNDSINRARGKLFGISGAMVIPFAPPAVSGLGTFGGFQFIVQDQGGHSFEEFAAVVKEVIRNGNTDPNLAGLFSSYTANDPQYVIEIDREKAKSLQIPIGEITQTLQVYLGSQYVNDFDFNNRSYRVYVQADKAARARPRDIAQFYVRSDNHDEMVPLESVVRIREATTPPVISHYNLFRSAEIDGSAAIGRSSGQAIDAMEQLSQRLLPRGIAYEWTGISLEEIESGSQALLLFGLGLLVVYLTLAAQYESFSLPFIVLLAVPMALLGALLAQWLRNLQNDVYAQIGLVMLIALSSKNSILIVEFAEQLRERGLSVTEAAIEAARIRLRPILMTSFAFILGVVPLVIAEGAGSAGRQSVGTTVFGGMLLSTLLNLVFIPVLYVMFKGRKELRAE